VDASLALMVVIALIAVNGFLVAAEYALVSVRRTRIQELVDDGSRRAASVKAGLDDINRYVATTQLGIVACTIGIGVLAQPGMSHLLEPPLTAIGIGGGALEAVALGVTLLLLTSIHVMVGTALPRNVALQKAERIALVAIPPLALLCRLLAPLTWLLQRLADGMSRLLGVEPPPGMHMIHSEEELKLLVSQSSKGGVLEDSEQEMLYNVFDFADTDVAQVMVPRPDVVGFPVDLEPAAMLEAVVSQPFTRYPIYRGSMDDVLGILHIRDLFTAVEQQGKDLVRVESLLRPAHVVPESKSLAGLLTDFRTSKSHLALVIDEYGSLAGIVTLEDLIEEIVGEIDDEHDRPEQPLEHMGEGHVRVDGKFSVEELNERFGLALPSGDYHTIGGVVFGLLGQAPHEGDVVRLGDVRMEVVETDGPRIVHVDIIMRGEGSSEEGDGAVERAARGDVPDLGDVSGLESGDDSAPASESELDLIPGADSRRGSAGGGPDA
jgi:CBS domain containing-hemolysin-like protein